jgi:hypothetical protein
LTDAEEKIKRNQYSPTKRTEGNTKRAQLYGRTFNWPPSHGGGHPQHPSPQPPVQCKGGHFDKCDISAANNNGFTVSTLTSSGWHKPECCKSDYTCKQFGESSQHLRGGFQRAHRADVTRSLSGHWKQGFCVRNQKDEDDCKKDIIKHVLLTKEQIFDYFWSKKLGH